MALQYVPPGGGGGGPPAACDGGQCPLNFGAPFSPGAGWVNAPLPGGYSAWGWPLPDAAAWASVTGGAPGWGGAAQEARLWPLLSEGTPFVTTSAGGALAPDWSLFPGDLPLAAANGSLADAQAAAEAGGTFWGYPFSSGARPVSNALSFVTLPAWPRQLSVPQAVAAAAAAARSSSWGVNASEADLAACLSSVVELLLRADYVTAPAGGGEFVRLDDVVISGPVTAALTAAVAAAGQAVYRQHAAAYVAEEDASWLYAHLLANLTE
jgi:hypothetical protein